MNRFVEAVLSRKSTNGAIEERVKEEGFDPKKIKTELTSSNVLPIGDLSNAVVTRERRAIPSIPS